MDHVQSAAAVRVALDTASHDTSVSPIYPRTFSLAGKTGTPVTLDTLSANFPDEMSAAFRADVGLGCGAPDLRAALGGTMLGALAEQVRLWFAWHYFGGTHSILWGTPTSEKAPMSPVGEWFEDSDDRMPASARLSVPVTAEVTSCPDCVGCAARYGGAFDLFVFIHNVRRVDRCSHAGGTVPALEVTYIDGARARAAVTEGRLSADDLTAVINYCNALASIEATTNNIRTDAPIENARGCCVNTHYKDTSSSIAAVAGVLHATSETLTPSKAQAAVINGSPHPELGLLRAALLPLDWDLWAWAAQSPRVSPARLLPLSSALCASVGGIGGGGNVVSGECGSALQHTSSPSSPARLPHLLTCMRAATETLVTARTIERIRRKEVTYRAAVILSGRRSEALPRLRAPEVCAPPHLASALHLDMLTNLLVSQRERQSTGEAIFDAPPSALNLIYRAGRTEAAPISAWEAGTNLAAITVFALAAALACGPPHADSQNVLLWLPPPPPPKVVAAKTVKGGGSKASEKRVKAGSSVTVTEPPPPSSPLGSAALTDDVWFTRALTSPPSNPSSPWVTLAFNWFRTRLQSGGFCDPVRRAAVPRDQVVLKGLAIAASVLVDAYELVRCDACGSNDTVLFVCDRCSMRVFCSQVCQRRDWQSGHRSVCFPLKAISTVAAP